MPLPRPISIMSHRSSPQHGTALDEKKGLRDVIAERDEKLREARELAGQAELALMNIDHTGALAIIRQIKGLL